MYREACIISRNEEDQIKHESTLLVREFGGENHHRRVLQIQGAGIIGIELGCLTSMQVLV